MQLQPYLFFSGRADEAIEFYKQALDAQLVMAMRFEESPEPAPPGFLPEGWGKKIMHADLKFGDATMLLSDGHGREAPGIHGFALTLVVKDAAEADRRFAALSNGGNVTVPLGKSFFSERFGMLQDRFGVDWMVIQRS